MSYASIEWRRCQFVCDYVTSRLSSGTETVFKWPKFVLHIVLSRQIPSWRLLLLLLFNSFFSHSWLCTTKCMLRSGAQKKRHTSFPLFPSLSSRTEGFSKDSIALVISLFRIPSIYKHIYFFSFFAIVSLAFLLCCHAEPSSVVTSTNSVLLFLSAYLCCISFTHTCPRGSALCYCSVMWCNQRF